MKLDDDKKGVAGIEYIRYEDPTRRSPCGTGTAVGRVYVIATHAVEMPKLLLNSREQLSAGVANNKGHVGKNLMDHPLYLTWGLTPKPTFPYRARWRPPASRPARRIFPLGPGRVPRRVRQRGLELHERRPKTTTLDFVDGRVSTVNPEGRRLFRQELIRKLNDIYTRQFRFGFLIEQSPCDQNRVTLNHTDDLGIPRPKIAYNLSDYTKRRIRRRRETYPEDLGRKTCVERVRKPPEKMRQDAGYFSYTDPETREPFDFEYFGSGHIVGTCRMGPTREDSVVDDGDPGIIPIYSSSAARCSPR